MGSKTVRKEQGLQGVVLFIAALMFAVILLGLALQQPSQLSTPEAIAASLFLAPFFDLALHIIRKAKTQRVEWSTQPSTSEKFFVGFDIAKSIFGIALICFMGLGFGYFMFRDTQSIRVGAAFFAQIGVYVAYFTIIRNVVLKVAGGIGEWIQPNSSPYLPRYTLKDGGLTLDLAITDLRDGNRKYLVEFSFDELDVLEAMEYMEARQYVQYQTGIDFGTKLKAGLSSIPEQIAYMQGKIPKPRHYANVRGRNLPVLIMIGTDLFYVISVANPDNTALIKAFQEHKKNTQSNG